MLIKCKIEIVIDETLQKKLKKNFFWETLNFIKNNNYSRWEATKKCILNRSNILYTYI